MLSWLLEYGLQSWFQRSSSKFIKFWWSKQYHKNLQHVSQVKKPLIIKFNKINRIWFEYIIFIIIIKTQVSVPFSRHSRLFIVIDILNNKKIFIYIHFIYTGFSIKLCIFDKCNFIVLWSSQIKVFKRCTILLESLFYISVQW